VGGEKMSKSLGNFTTLAEALDAHGPRAFRMAVLQTHYRRAIELGDAELGSAAAAVDRLDALMRRAQANGITGSTADEVAVARFRDAMDDDFATPAAMAVVFDAVSAAHQALSDGDHARAATMFATVETLVAVIGLELAAAETGGDAEIDELVGRRNEARAQRDFAVADAIRDELAARGIVLEDTANGTIWHRA